jgi:hypothetical protein
MSYERSYKYLFLRRRSLCTLINCTPVRCFVYIDTNTQKLSSVHKRFRGLKFILSSKLHTSECMRYFFQVELYLDSASLCLVSHSTDCCLSTNRSCSLSASSLINICLFSSTAFCLLSNSILCCSISSNSRSLDSSLSTSFTVN